MSLLHVGKKNTYFYNPAWIFHFISSPLRLGPINWWVFPTPIFYLNVGEAGKVCARVQNKLVSEQAQFVVPMSGGGCL